MGFDGQNKLLNNDDTLDIVIRKKKTVKELLDEKTE